MMRRLTLFAMILALSACASGSGSSTGGPARPPVQTVGGAEVGRMQIASASSATTIPLTAAADAVWRIMPSVFDSLGIPITNMDPARKEIGNSAFKIRSRLAKVSLSRYLDCGNTQIGPNADNYDVVLTVMAVVTATGPASANVATLVDAQARPATYNQAYSRCSSKGALEQRMVDLIKLRLSK